MSATLPVVVRLSQWDEITQSVVTTLVILVPLVFGGLLAYLLNSVVPLELRRRKLFDAIDTLLDELREVHRSGTAYEDLRTLISTDGRELREKLTGFVRGSPELSASIGGFEAAVEILQLKSQSLNRISALRRGLPDLPERGAATGQSILARREAPRLCRGSGSSLTFSGVCPP